MAHQMLLSFFSPVLFFFNFVSIHSSIFDKAKLMSSFPGHLRVFYNAIQDLKRAIGNLSLCGISFAFNPSNEAKKHLDKFFFECSC